MRPSEVCKSAGLKSLAQLSEISGESVQTLNNWYKNEPRRFELILKGALFEKTMRALDAVESNVEPDTAEQAAHKKKGNPS